MVWGVVEDHGGGVEPQAIQMVLAHPVDRVLDEELAYGRAVGAVEVERLPPVGDVAIGEIAGREGVEVAVVRSEVVVDDVEDHPEPETVRGVDEAPEVIWPTVEA